MSHVTVDALIRDFRLPRTVADEIIATERQRAMRSHWQCWILLLLPFTVLALLLWSGQWRGGSALFVIAAIAANLCAQYLGDRYAQPAVLKAARDKAQRLEGKYPPPRHSWPDWRI